MAATLHHIQSMDDLALAFVSQHAAEHLERDQNLLVERTATQLQERFSCGRQTALDTAALAVSAHAYREAQADPDFGGWYIDQSRSNSYCIFIRSTRGAPTRVLTLVDLLRAAKLFASEAAA